MSIHRVENDVEPSHYLLAMKGAPERIIDVCTTILTSDGRVELLDDEWRDKINRAYLQLGGMGERVLGSSLHYYYYNTGSRHVRTGSYY